MKIFSSLPEHCRAPVLAALLAAFLFGLNAPLSKSLLLRGISPMFMVAFLYMGAGVGMFLLERLTDERKKEAPLSRKEMPWTVSMILLDVLAPLLLMLGLESTSAANASLLLNFEMAATSLAAFCFFREAVGKRMWLSLGVITAASLLLSVDFSATAATAAAGGEAGKGAGGGAWSFSYGSLLILAACGCWGVENNCTRNMSEKSPAQIVIVKGFGSGGTALALAWLLEDPLPDSFSGILASLLLGFVAYGLSIFCYVKAQRHLGAARTSAYYAAAPFLGVLLSMLILRETPSWNFFPAAALMAWGVWLAVHEKHSHEHRHEALSHNHAHRHPDLHHTHVHVPPVTGRHTHEHVHEPCVHTHVHTPDTHHRHSHP